MCKTKGHEPFVLRKYCKSQKMVNFRSHIYSKPKNIYFSIICYPEKGLQLRRLSLVFSNAKKKKHLTSLRAGSLVGM